MRRLIDFLPSSNTDDVPEWPSFDDAERLDFSLDTLAPENANTPYDIKELVIKTVDEGDFFEIQETYARNIVTGFGRIEGRTIGFVANQPMVLAGVLNSDASRKAARFVRFCDCFNIPIVSFVDVPGFLPGVAQEYGGLIKHGAKLLFAYAEATAPKVTIITRKAFGGAYDVMAPKAFARRHQFRLADGADRGHGRQGRGRDHFPAGYATPKIAERTPRVRRALPVAVLGGSGAISTKSSCRIRPANASPARWRWPAGERARERKGAAQAAPSVARPARRLRAGGVTPRLPAFRFPYYSYFSRVGRAKRNPPWWRRRKKNDGFRYCSTHPTDRSRISLRSHPGYGLEDRCLRTLARKSHPGTGCFIRRHPGAGWRALRIIRSLSSQPSSVAPAMPVGDNISEGGRQMPKAFFVVRAVVEEPPARKNSIIGIRPTIAGRDGRLQGGEGVAVLEHGGSRRALRRLSIRRHGEARSGRESAKPKAADRRLRQDLAGPASPAAAIS